MPAQAMSSKKLKRQVGYETSNKSQKKGKGYDIDSMVVN
jgi:hypothetical protein